jgi:error-prone DNA polymerase
VNPNEIGLLFERFVSEERQEPPDIDVDFEHERREEVIQYLYRKYGRDRAAIAATVISYRPRSAIREVGKVLGLTEDVTGALAGTVWGAWGDSIFDDHVRRAGLDPDEPRLRMTLQLAHELIGFPRHLSQHVGGFVLTRKLLIDTVPVGNGAMKDRTFCEWDKDDLHELELMKVDVLALGMLTAIKKSFDMLERDYGRTLTLASVPREDPAVYEMLCEADSLGVFQVESRAQMNMLPRLRPNKFYDLVVEVAIVRPGPIQGDMVHPYLRRRQGLEPIEFPEPAGGDRNELRRVLGKTLGVPLFQEQAMRIAIEAAGFTPDEANQLRRAMATFRHVGTIGTLHAKLVEGMVGRGYNREFAERCFKQIEGFGEYGFPESHAASFALLVYASSWIKLHHPEVFCAALLNSQPMGFYAPAQIVRDAREHQVEVRHPDINASLWNCTLEVRTPLPEGEGGARSAQPSGRVRGYDVESLTPHPPKPDGLGPSLSLRERCDLRHAVRLGFRSIDGFREEWATTLVEEREQGGPYRSIDDLRARARLPAAALDALASADAAQSLQLTRRRALWAAKGLPPAKPAPLFEYAGLREGDGAPPDALPVAPLSDEVIQDYQTLRLSLKAHPLSFLRDTYQALGAITAAETLKVRDGAPCAMAGVVLVRQMPGSAKGVVFMTLEDETGVVNTVVWPSVFEEHRPIAMGARLVLARGRIQRSDNVTHLVVDTLEDRSGDLATLSEAKFDPPFARSDEVTHPMPAKGGGGGLHPKPPSLSSPLRGGGPKGPRGPAAPCGAATPATSAFSPARGSSIDPLSAPPPRTPAAARPASARCTSGRTAARDRWRSNRGSARRTPETPQTEARG